RYGSDRDMQVRASLCQVDTLRGMLSSPGTVAQTGACRRGRPEDAGLVVTGYTGAVGAGVPGERGEG
ncbi:hypothetical protein, partial [uncultured Duncaniella sp.]|uniref:hypothetical protein n=1 Tax=uncultured Duncaniella sp. TaxID=2768039 RepID=UPI0026EA4376